MNTPKLRFKEFDGEWEEKRFLDIVNRVSQSSNSNTLPKVEFEDIAAGEGRLNKDVTNKFDSRKGTLFKPNNILYGKLRPYLKNWLFPHFEGVALGDFWVLEAINTNPSFVYVLIQSEPYQKVANDTAGTKMPRSDWKKVSTTIFSIPSNINEQEKIGTFFEMIDKKIQLQQERIELLKQQKKGFMQKLFPKTGETQPEFRFNGFSGDWEQQPLKEVGDFLRASVDPQTTPDAKFIEYSMPAYDNGRLPEQVFGKSMQSMRLKITGEVLLINKLNVRQKRIWLVKEATDNSVASSEFMPFTSEKINMVFLEQLMLSNNTTRDLESISSGTSNSQKRITPSDLLKYQIKFPKDYAEQIKIGEFLAKIDQKIILIDKNLLALQEQKQAFMQQMFV